MLAEGLYRLTRWNITYRHSYTLPNTFRITYGELDIAETRNLISSKTTLKTSTLGSLISKLATLDGHHMTLNTQIPHPAFYSETKIT